MDKLNLIWIEVEGGAGGGALQVSGRRPPIDNVPFPAVHLSNLVCGWISTVGSVSGMLTGISPAYLLSDHVSKGSMADEKRFDLLHKPYPVFLEGEGYQVKGVSLFLCFREQIPFFYERHEGVGPDMLCRVPDNYTPRVKSTYYCEKEKKPLYRYEDVEDCSNLALSDDVILERVRAIAGSLDDSRPSAFFIHLNEADCIPELFGILSENGLTAENSVMVVIGDHGFPGDRFAYSNNVIQGRFSHDKGMTEHDLRIVGYLGYPGCKETAYEDVCISWDMMPTVATLMGYDASRVLPAATGKSLVPYLSGYETSPKRVLRVDNRYIKQDNLKVVCFLDEKYRYVFRYSSAWGDSPYYNYYQRPVPYTEELYSREDLNEEFNLIYSPEHLPVLQRFRKHFAQTESEIIRHHFGEDVFAYPALNRIRFGLPERYRSTESGRLPVSQEAVVKGLMAALKMDIQQKGYSKVALVGTASDVEKLMVSGVFSKGDFVGRVSPKIDNLTGMLEGVEVETLSESDYDCLVLVSYDHEAGLYRECRRLAPGVPILSPYRTLPSSMPGASPLVIPDEGLLEYFRTRAGVIYGAGGRTRDFLKQGGAGVLGMTFRAVFDSSPALHNTELEGVPVLTYPQLGTKDIDQLDFDYFLVSSIAYNEIVKDIMPWTLQGKKIFRLNSALQIEADPLPRGGTWQPFLRDEGVL